MEDGELSRRKKHQDLRRKILRRNFLREQISTVPAQSNLIDSETIVYSNNRENLNPVLIESSSEDMEVDVETNSDSEDNSDIENVNSSQNAKVRHNVRKCQNSRWKSSLNINFSHFTTMKLSHVYPNQTTSVPQVDDICSTGESSGSSKEISTANLLNESEVELPNEIVGELKNKVAKSVLKNRGIVKAKYVNTKGPVVNDKSHKNYFKHLKRKVKNCFSKVQKVLVNTADYERVPSAEIETNKAVVVSKPLNDSNAPKIKQLSSNCMNNNLLSRNRSFMGNKLNLNLNSNISSNIKSKECIDLNLSLNEMRKLEIANRHLQEENRVLSESLSSIMANVDLVYNYYTRSRAIKSSSNENIQNSTNLSQNESYMKSEHSYSQSPRPTKVKVLRSRSLHEQAERRLSIRQRLSSHSMCHHPYSRYPQRTLYRAKPCIVAPCSSPKEYPLIKPKDERTPVLPTGSNKSPIVLNRRSSMPERNKRPSVARRASCAQDIPLTRSRQSLLSLPIDAFY